MSETPSQEVRRTSPIAPLARAAYRSGYVLAVLCVALGVAAIIAQVPTLEALGRPSHAWPALRWPAAGVLVALGVALWLFLERRYTAAVAASALGVGASALAVISYLAPIALPGGGMALTSAVLLGTASVAVLLASGRRRLFSEEAAIGIAGVVLVALTTTFLIARASGLVDPVADHVVAGVAVQVILCCFLVGACFIALVWSRGLLAGDSAGWLPGALGVAGAITVIVLWRALATRESDHLQALIRQASEERRQLLVREAGITARSLHRAGEWRAAGASFAQQRRDFEALRRDIHGLEAAGWISSLGVVDTAASVALSGAGADAVTLAYVNRIGRLADTLAFLPLDSASRRFAIIAPACKERTCLGAMVAVARSGGLFQGLLPDTSAGYGFGLSGPGGLIIGYPSWAATEPRYTQWLSLQLGAVHLTLAAWPTRSTIDQVRSELPALVLLMGLIGSALVAVSALLGQYSLRAARESERVRITSALERTTDGIWDWDLVTGASNHTAAIWRYLGYDPEAVPSIRGAWLALVHPDDLPGLRRAIDSYLSGATPTFEAEYRVLAKDASWHTIADRGRVVSHTPSGQPARMLGIKADVTIARATQRAKDAAEERFREIFDSGFQFQLLLDRGGIVLEVNEHALAETRADATQVRGKVVWNTLWWAGHEEAQDRLRTAAAAALRGTVQRYEDQLTDGDGAPVYLEIAVKQIMDETGAPNQLLLEARDLTARRRAEATLREVDTLTSMGRVAARVAHEINNPLAGIQNSFLLIKGAIPTSHPHYQFVGAIEREIKRIAQVTRQLYETYRPEQDSSGESSVATVLGDAVAFLEQVNRSSGVRVEMELTHGPSVIHLPSAMLRQIAYNLVQNAIEASKEGDTVYVRTYAEDGHFELRVRDSGPGIPCDAREKVFQSFYTTKNGRLRTGGMGLGLALVRRTVTAAGGTIEISDPEGGGCEFIVRLPLEAVPA